MDGVDLRLSFESNQKRDGERPEKTLDSVWIKHELLKSKITLNANLLAAWLLFPNGLGSIFFLFGFRRKRF
jgi:hypothetical protein